MDCGEKFTCSLRNNGGWKKRGMRKDIWASTATMIGVESRSDLYQY